MLKFESITGLHTVQVTARLCSVPIILRMATLEVGGSGSEELTKCPPPSSTVLCFVNSCERKPR